MSQSSTEPQPSGRRRSSTSAASAVAPSAGCDIESVGPNGEITWKRMQLSRKQSVQAEFPEFSRRGVDRLREAFEEFDADKDGHLGLEDLKLMMERLKAPQTHLGLKALLKEFDSDGDGRLDFRGFLALFRKAAAGQFAELDILMAWFAEYVGVSEVNVSAVGVSGAKNFFDAKIAIHQADDRIQADIREEQRRKQAEEEARQQSQERFNAKRAQFQPSS